MTRRTSKAIQPLTPVPMMPVGLTQDTLPLPERYYAPDWTRDVIKEWERETDLIAVGAYPTQSILLHGPSGTGKTTAAAWLAKKLNRPVYSMLLASSIESYLGRTGSNILKAINYARAVPCILVFDELDAIAGKRGNHQDVGEIWRITNALIQVLDQWHSTRQQSLLVATTNLADAVDGAVRRRFELELETLMPSHKELSLMAGVPLPSGFSVTHAEMRRLILHAKRHSVLYEKDYSLTLQAFIVNGHHI